MNLHFAGVAPSATNPEKAARTALPYGLLRVSNALGPELPALSVGPIAQCRDGIGFIGNTLDSLTGFAATTMVPNTGEATA